MPKKKAPPKPETIKLYHKTSCDLAGIGYCGPNKAAPIPYDTAQLYLREFPQLWSRKPFIDLATNPLEEKADG